MAAGSPLIGREMELAALGAAFEGDQAIVLLGEAGIGKTALVRAAAAVGERRLREGGAFATLRASPYLALRRATMSGLRGDPATVAGRVEAEVGPDLLFVDDAQWADDATLSACVLLAGRVGLVVAIRSLDPGAAGATARLEAAGALVRPIAPLSGDAARMLVATRRPGLPERIVADIVRRAAGNPLLLEELTDGGDAAPVLARVMTSRLDQLSAAARDVVELLAVAEQPVPRDSLGDGAGEALEAGVAVATGTGVEVRHQLVADAVRDGLADETRQRHHARAAALLPDAADVARHLAAAGRGTEATEVALRALSTVTDARDRAALLLIAAETSPPAEAMARRLAAARALDEVADWVGVQRTLERIDGAATPEVRVEAGALHAHAAFALGDIATCRGHLAVIDAEATAGAVEPGGPADVRRAIELATFLVNAEGAVEAALARLDQVAAAIAPGASEAEDVAALRASILLLATGQGDVDRIRAAADGAFEAGRFRTATDRARVVQYFLNMAIGCEDALEFLLDRHARYEEAGLASMAHDFLADAVVAATLSGRLQEAVTIADRLLEEPAPPRPRQMAAIYRARALALLGRIDDAAAALESLRPSATADFFGLGELLIGLADAAYWGGRLDAARRWAEAALSVPAPLPVAQVHARVQLAWARRETGDPPDPPAGLGHTPSTSGAEPELRAITSAAAGDHRDAAGAFAAAAAAWTRFHMPRAVQCRWAAADELAQAGDVAGAVAGLRSALAEAEAMDFEPLAARIRRSLRLLGLRTSRPPAPRGSAQLGLTARERELVELVERGLTNTEIARRLGLGRPTVARILGSAMSKLGVVTRAELAATVPR